MRKQPALSINGVLLPVRAAGAINQDYEDFGGFTATPLRFANGSPLVQQAWRKVRTTLTATGLIPPGLNAIDLTQTVTLGCVSARSIQSASNVITIPAGRRTDAAPYGFALHESGLLRPVSVSLAGDVATLAVVAGAVGYQVLWYPLLTVVAPGGVRSTFDAAAAEAGWQIVAEEV